MVQLVRAIETEGRFERRSGDHLSIDFSSFTISLYDLEKKKEEIREIQFDVFLAAFRENKNKQEIEFVPFNLQKGKKEIL